MALIEEVRISRLADALGVPHSLGPVTYAIIRTEVVLRPSDAPVVRSVLHRLAANGREWEAALAAPSQDLRETLAAAVPGEDARGRRAGYVVGAVLDAVRGAIVDVTA